MVHICVQGDTIGTFSELIPTNDSADIGQVLSNNSRPVIRRGRQTVSVVAIPRPIPNDTLTRNSSPLLTPLSSKPYDYLLKFLLVGDSDVGKQEILSTLENAASDMPFCAGPGMIFSIIFTVYFVLLCYSINLLIILLSFLF